MISVTAKVTPSRKQYVRLRAKQENCLSESEFINRLIEADELRQGCRGQHEPDPAIMILRRLNREIPKVLLDRAIDKLERSNLTRLTVSAANSLVNHTVAICRKTRTA